MTFWLQNIYTIWRYLGGNVSLCGWCTAEVDSRCGCTPRCCSPVLNTCTMETYSLPGLCSEITSLWAGVAWQWDQFIKSIINRDLSEQHICVCFEGRNKHLFKESPDLKNLSKVRNWLYSVEKNRITQLFSVSSKTCLFLSPCFSCWFRKVAAI